MTEAPMGISDEAVADATGHDWAHWFTVLDENDATTLTHKDRVVLLADAGVESGWWQQQLAVGYERERGLREVGETADAGFQVGVQRTLPIPQDDLWTLLTSKSGLAVWLGDTGPLAIESGSRYETPEGTTGEIRTTKDHERIRLTWQPPDRPDPTTLQLTVTPAESDPSRCVLRFHHENLADTTERETLREHWRAVLDRLEHRITSNIDHADA